MITIDTWLYGELADYGGDEAKPGFANMRLGLPEGACLQDLLNALGMPTEKRGITFVNGNLTAMPGKQPDLDLVLRDGDRVAFFHLRAMWPYQYRQGAAILSELEKQIKGTEGGAMHHT